MDTKQLLVTYRALPLFVGLVVLLTVFPFLPDGMATSITMRVMYTTILLAGIFAVSQRHLMVVIAIVLVLPAIASRWIPGDVGRIGPVALQVSNIAAQLFIGGVVFAHVMRPRTLVTDKIFAAVTVYLLVGTAFSDIYALLELVEPGSLRLGSEPGSIDRDELIYFSFTTLTTLGYGDITPVTHRARVLTSLEAPFGVMYIAVVIAGLVGSSHQGRPSRRDDHEDMGG
jgi:hypothetical protein